MIYNDFVHLFLLTEGYSDVKKRLIDDYNIEENKLNDLFNFHQKYKNNFKETKIHNQSIDASNIDAYFSKNNIAKYTIHDLINALIERSAEIQASLSTQTKAESKIEDLKKLIVSETNDYVFFKVPTWEDAVKLKRPGKNNPWNLPPMIPVEWCVTADSSEGKRMFEQYTEPTINHPEADFNNVFSCFDKVDYFIINDYLYMVNLRANFYFFFRKNISLEKSKIKNYNYIAINCLNNGKFTYTIAPNSSMKQGWPKEVPIELQSKIEPPEKIKTRFGPVDIITPKIWSSILKINPNLYSKCNKWDEFTSDDWSGLLAEQPKFNVLCNKYKGWEKFYNDDWVHLLANQPQFVSMFEQYNGGWNKFNDWEWGRMIIRQPQLIPIFIKYDGWKKFNVSDWCDLIIQQPDILKIKFIAEKLEQIYRYFKGKDWSYLLSKAPQFIDKCNKYDGWVKLDEDDWYYLLSFKPQFVDKCDEYKGWATFSGDTWSIFLSEQPQFANKCDEYHGWRLFKTKAWINLLQHRPQFADKCDEYIKWDRIYPIDWVELLIKQPQFADKCDKYNGWDDFDIFEWVELLGAQSQFINKCNMLHQFNEDDWNHLLEIQPKLKEIAKHYAHGREALQQIK